MAYVDDAAAGIPADGSRTVHESASAGILQAEAAEMETRNLERVSQTVGRVASVSLRPNTELSRLLKRISALYWFK